MQPLINNISTDESTDEKCFNVFLSLNNKTHIIFYDLGRELLLNIFGLLNKVYILKYKIVISH